MDINADCAAAKEKFIRRYNPEKSLDKAAREAIGAALGRNPTYCGPYDQIKRAAFRYEWQLRLEEIAHDTALFSSVDDACAIILLFRKQMRGVIARGVSAKRLPVANFHISHAQKSISVYLKHLWCMGLAPMPALCPIDRRILTKANAPQAHRGWVHVDDIEYYKAQVELLVRIAKIKKLSLAKWELLNF